MTTAARHIPNIITAMRLVLTPLFVHFAMQGRYVCAIGMVALIGLTDILDGAAARALGACTRLGAVLDVVVDLAYTMASLLALNQAGLVPAFFTVVVALKFLEFAITSGAMKKGGACTGIWEFDRLGRCFAAMVFWSPGVICLLALLSNNAIQVGYFFLIPVCVFGVASSIYRVSLCIRTSPAFSAARAADRMVETAGG